MFSIERKILHSDLNGFYASVECMLNPEIRGKPVAVCGSTEDRHGIVLAKNELAKKFYIKTGEATWQAKNKCPELVIVPPHFEQYQRFSQAARDIYADYSPFVEPFGLDECWVDLTGAKEDGKQIADEIRKRMKFELGISCSVGVSFNKIFAKLASDIKKPDATTVISEENYQQIAWSLPVSDLLYVGPATTRKLARYNIDTIGRLAKSDPELLQRRLGKWGITLWQFANGLDSSPVAEAGQLPFVKSIGNSTTAPKDLITVEDIQITVFVLAESVAERLRDGGYKCNTVQVSIRYSDLSSFERQQRLDFPCCTAQRIGYTAMKLILENEDGRPIRSLGVRATNLIHDEYPQQSLLPEVQEEQRQENLEFAIDHLRRRYGHYMVQRGMMLTDQRLSGLSPKDDHTIHPVSYFR